MDIDKTLIAAVHDGIREGLKTKLMGYKSPVDGIVTAALDRETPALRELLVSSISSAIGDPDFQEQVRKQVRVRLAKKLIERFGGEMERQINTLKSDPATRAKITVAIDDIVSDLAAAK